MFYTYITTNKRNGTLYVGHTEDISLRMEQHKQRIFKGFASKYSCDRLVWFSTFNTRDEAFRRERQIKAWRRRWKLELIETENPKWLDISALPVWPLPKGELFSSIRATAIERDSGSHFSVG
jgi:putative endonuclease